ncbi:cobalt ABC transporter ATP-binding protein [Moorella sp. E308F]|jgi:cobalt/nickel transport system ATP-binding protein|uniref:energy-coupling factor ABC transporter ATP-binding protein n=1 Tax=Moorella sp. E308F TaxID=2572682 RepID=UPI0010FFB3E2|nr:energy-coupling factor ABC transporter ATP-binding protein [Moorella sp. E308F]GEA16445.1 cobalt ABC transporter ATP-binding protein [Moorella sp. E308F]
MTEVVRVKCLRHVYPDKTEVRFCGLDFVVRAGERVMILGPNGSGKTTLLAHLTGLLKPVEGEVQVLGVDPVREFASLRRRVGVVFQNVDEQIIGPTVWDDIALAPRNSGLKPGEVRELVENILRAMDIYHLKDKIPHYLSGGEKKKVALAGAMVMRPELLLLDEPFDGLDPRSKREIIHLLDRFNHQFGTTIVMTNHDINLVPLVADRIYVISEGVILMQGSPREVFARLDILRQANLEPPLLVELFAHLSREGIPVNLPLTLEEARQELLPLLKSGLTCARYEEREPKRVACLEG